MDFVALLSGGKDSCFNIYQCQRYGHRLVCLANLHPPENQHELNSFMYQCAGYSVIPAYEECLGVPLIRKEIKGKASNVALDYEPTPIQQKDDDEDEVEDLYELLRDVVNRFPSIKGVSCGAIVSTYQRLRVENVCQRLGLTCLSYLWQRDRSTLIQDIIRDGFDVVLVKVAGAGLDPYKHLGKSLHGLLPTLQRLHEKLGLDLCGEGGEYESLVLDGPIFQRKLVVEEASVLLDDEDSSVGSWMVSSWHTEPKECSVSLSDIPQDTYVQVVQERAKRLIGSMEGGKGLRRAQSARPQSMALHVDPSGLGQSPLLLSSSSSVSLHQIPLSLSAMEEVLVVQLKEIMEMLGDALAALGGAVRDIVFVRAFLSDLSLFSAFNTAYALHFPSRHPPSRSCVQAHLPGGHAVALEVTFLLRSFQPSQLLLDASRRSVLQVRSMSSWAPQCIGPYAQSNEVHRALLFVAGQIALLPGTMQLLPSSTSYVETVTGELLLCLKNLQAILRVQEASLRGVVGWVLFVNTAKLQGAETEIEDRFLHVSAALNAVWRDLVMEEVEEDRRRAGGGGKKVDALGDEYEDEEEDNEEECCNESADKLTKRPAVTIVGVKGLPRGALVEVEALAVKDALLRFNFSFEEELWSECLVSGSTTVAGPYLPLQDMRTWSMWTEDRQWGLGDGKEASRPQARLSFQVKYLPMCLLSASVDIYNHRGEAGEDVGEEVLRHAVLGLTATIQAKASLSPQSWQVLRVYYTVDHRSPPKHPYQLQQVLQRIIKEVVGAPSSSSHRVPAVVCVAVDALPESDDGPCAMSLHAVAVDLQQVETERWISSD